MHAFPKYINTRQDIFNLYQLYPEETKAYIQNLMENRYIWQAVGPVPDGETGIVDDNHMVIDGVGEDSTTMVKIQMEKVEDQNCRLFRLGFTVEEASEFIEAASDLKSELG